MSVAAPSVETCAAEWQSRGVAEIAVKFVAMHITTLVLVADFATLLNMPRTEKACYILGAALYPTWTALVLIFRLSRAAFGIIHSAITHPAWPKRVALNFSKAVGMYAVAVDQRPAGVTSASLRPPREIPVSELDCFKYRDASTNTVFPTKSEFNACRSTSGVVRKPWLSNVTSMFLTIAYLVQAVLTLHLVVRRTQLDEYDWSHMGVLFFEDDQFERGGFWGLTASTPVTFADIQTAQLAFLGVVVVILHQTLRLADISWQYIDKSYAWTFEDKDEEGPKFVRLVLGWIIIAFAETIFSCTMRPVAFYVLLYKALYPYVEEPTLFLRAWLTGVVVGATGALLVIAPRSSVVKGLPRILRSILMLPALYLTSFDFDHQFPVLQRFIHDQPGGSHTKKLSEKQAKFDRVAYQLVYFATGLAAFLYHLAGLAVIIAQQSGREIPAVTAKSGCIYTTELYPWMWKDPLADRLWAF